jgi:hypothetical protein
MIHFVISFQFSFLNRDIFEEDNYSPIPIVSEEEYKIVISKFPFQDPDLEKVQTTF